MKEISINCNTKGTFEIDDLVKLEGLNKVLVNEEYIPISRYEFSRDKLSNLLYYASNVRACFYGNIEPTMIYECRS